MKIIFFILLYYNNFFYELFENLFFNSSNNLLCENKKNENIKSIKTNRKYKFINNGKSCKIKLLNSYNLSGLKYSLKLKLRFRGKNLKMSHWASDQHQYPA